MRRPILGVAVVGLFVAAQAGAFEISTSAFEPEGDIPSQYTCEGDDVSPALTWTAPPEGTRSLALVVQDPDAPDPKVPRITWIHWVLYNLPPEAGSLARGVRSEDLPPGTRRGQNSWKRMGYGGPCPPIGRHRYYFKLYALDTVLENKGALSNYQLQRAMTGHILAETETMCTYQKQKRP